MNKEGASYYGQQFHSMSEAKEALAFSRQHDPDAKIVKVEKPYTNADHIRSMTDAELGAFLDWITDCCQRECCKDCNMFLGEWCDIDAWLRQPYEDTSAEE